MNCMCYMYGVYDIARMNYANDKYYTNYSYNKLKSKSTKKANISDFLTSKVLFITKEKNKAINGIKIANSKKFGIFI